jgi:hypothetical protein
MRYSDEDLVPDLQAQKIEALEKELYVTKELLSNCIDSLKETQRYLMKLAYNQSEISKRVSAWPYIVVSSSRDDDVDI